MDKKYSVFSITGTVIVVMGPLMLGALLESGKLVAFSVVWIASVYLWCLLIKFFGRE